MCPSYLATREEKDSTRGRAHVLQDVANGTLGFDDPAVGEALDLCLSCKGCARDCPTGIDMATYKSEALSQKYAGKAAPALPLRPRPAAALGPDDPAEAGQRHAAQQDGRPDRQGRGRGRPAAEPAAVLASSRCASRTRSPLAAQRRRVDLGRLLHRPVRRRHRPGGDRAARVDGPASGRHPREGVLRPDLDHHRPARRPPGGSSAQAVETLHALRRRAGRR